MLSHLLSYASSYTYLPVDDQEEDSDVDGLEKSGPRVLFTAASVSPKPTGSITTTERETVMAQILTENQDLYRVLGIQKSSLHDKMALRRAYLARSKVCHPDKYPNDPDATKAFQKLSVAYDILSKPSSRRAYELRSTRAPYDVFSARSRTPADETFRAVILGVFNDFLDGDLEVIRSMLRSIGASNPSLKFGEENIDSVIHKLQGMRQNVLTCRSMAWAIQGEMVRLIDAQYELRSLSYFDILGRTRVSVQLTRITLNLPVVLELALISSRDSGDGDNSSGSSSSSSGMLPRRMKQLIRALDSVLERIERIL